MTRVLLSMIVLLTARVASANFTTVTSGADSNVSGPPGTGVCSLRNAIRAANTTITEANSGCTWTLATGIPVIYLMSGTTYTLSLPGAEDLALTGDLDLLRSVVIEVLTGPPATITAGATGERVIDSRPGGGERVFLRNVVITGGSSTGPGGGIAQVSGNLDLDHVVVTGNTAAGAGGGIHIGLGRMVMFASRVELNTTTGAGAGGGGLCLATSGVTASVWESSFTENTTAQKGGGVAVAMGTIFTALGTTISDNHATGHGGGVYNASGGIVVLFNATVANNDTTMAAGNGGGVYNEMTGTVYVKNSVIAANVDNGGQAPDCATNGGELTSHGYNFFGDLTGCTIADDNTGNINGGVHGLGPLTLRTGDASKYRPLGRASLLIDAGAPDGCIDSTFILDTDAEPHSDKDQRSSPRVQRGRCDIGAVESGHYVVDSTLDSPDTNTSDGLCSSFSGGCTLRAAVLQASAWAGYETIAIGAATYTLSAGELDITDELDLRGAAANTTIIDANGLSRVARIRGPVTAEWRDLTLRGGHTNGATPGAALSLEVQAGSPTLTLRRALVTSSTITGAGHGGGIATTGALKLVDSAVTGCSTSAGSGGGIANLSGTVDLVNSTVSGNVAGGTGGGVFVQSPGGGRRLALYNATIAGNNAASGGGVAIASGFGEAKNSILASNTTQDCGGALTLNGYAFLGASAGCTVTQAGTGNVVDQALMLAPLDDYGGPTPSQPVTQASPARDAGTPVGSGGCVDELGALLTADQRGVARPLNGRCDAGAIELGTTNVAVTASTPAAPIALGGSLSYVINVTNTGAIDAHRIAVAIPGVPDLTMIQSQAACTPKPNVVCTFSKLAPAAVGTINLQLTPTAGGAVARGISVTMIEIDANTADNATTLTGTVTTSAVAVAADVGIAVSGPAELGDGLVRYVISASNAGPDTATNVVWHGAFTGFTVVHATPSAGTCTLVGTDFSCALGPLGNSASTDVVLVLRFTSSEASAAFSVDAIENDPNTTNDATTLTAIAPPPDNDTGTAPTNAVPTDGCAASTPSPLWLLLAALTHFSLRISQRTRRRSL